MITDLKNGLAPLVAFLILAVVGIQTFGALRDSGTWAAKPRTSRVAAPDPYAALEALMAATVQSPADLRDPFSYNRTPVVARRAPQPRPHVPPPLPKPILTAIIADNDPRALIRYQERNFTVKPGDVFIDFKVVSIAADQVVLDRDNGEHFVLTRPRKGD